MSPAYRFMTGATQYRIEAKSVEEALQIAFEELCPTEETKAVILQTLYDEAAARRYVDIAPQPDPGSVVESSIASEKKSNLRLAGLDPSPLDELTDEAKK